MIFTILKDLPETYAIRRYTVTTAVTGAEGVRKKLKRYVSPEEGKHFDPRSSHQILIDLAKDGVHNKSIITNQVVLLMAVAIVSFVPSSYLPKNDKSIKSSASEL